jgi:hypothetical protein
MQIPKIIKSLLRPNEKEALAPETAKTKQAKIEEELALVKKQTQSLAAQTTPIYQAYLAQRKETAKTELHMLQDICGDELNQLKLEAETMQA